MSSPVFISSGGSLSAFLLLLVQLRRREPVQRFRIDSDELRERVEHLTEREFGAFREHRHRADAVLLYHVLARAGGIEDVDDGEVQTAFRKKLFRSKAATSSGLREIEILVVAKFHELNS
jgi:hypothetical protein